MNKEYLSQNETNSNDAEKPEKLYCGNKEILPEGYTGFSPRHGCLKKGFGVGRGQANDKIDKYVPILIGLCDKQKIMMYINKNNDKDMLKFIGKYFDEHNNIEIEQDTDLSIAELEQWGERLGISIANAEDNIEQLIQDIINNLTTQLLSYSTQYTYDDYNDDDEYYDYNEYEEHDDPVSVDTGDDPVFYNSPYNVPDGSTFTETDVEYEPINHAPDRSEFADYDVHSVTISTDDDIEETYSYNTSNGRFIPPTTHVMRPTDTPIHFQDTLHSTDGVSFNETTLPRDAKNYNGFFMIPT
jgi:hypothetical protein